MATGREDEAYDGLESMTKNVVSIGKGWMLAARDAAVTPWLHWARRNVPMSTALLPWIEMTKEVQDQMLQSWEAQSHRAIETTFNAVGSMPRPRG